MNKSLKIILSIVAMTTFDWATDISTWKSNYTSGTDIWIEIEDKPDNAQDWVGIYPKGANNSWNNVVAWRWAKNTSATQYDKGDWYKFDLDDGAYEARFFLNNSYTVEDKVSFTVGKQVNNRYGNFGNYVVEKYLYNDTTIYYAPEKINAPVVFFVTGYKISIESYDGLLKFIASHGYYVIPIYESGDFASPEKYAKKLENILKVAIDNDNVDASKIGVIGHSSGGGDAFYIMNYFKNKNKKYNNIKFASKANFVISLDGWFDFGMTTSDINNLNTSALIMQFGGSDGVKSMQDPRINLSIYNKLKNKQKAFSFISPENHGYLTGDVVNKKDLLAPIHAMLEYSFENNYVAKSVALKDQVNQITLKGRDNYQYKCQVEGHDYCNPSNFK